MAWHGMGYPGERKRLREWWAITTREEWQYCLRDLLACDQHSSVWDFALGVRRLIGRITRYEARMRADGVLDENRHVSSVDAWDHGRASKTARWGLGARFGTLKEAESAVIQAGRAAARSYKSWRDFSAGYILGRSLHFDEEEFGPWYEDMISAHRTLMFEPDSPWLTIPFR